MVRQAIATLSLLAITVIAGCPTPASDGGGSGDGGNDGGSTDMGSVSRAVLDDSGGNHAMQLHLTDGAEIDVWMNGSSRGKLSALRLSPRGETSTYIQLDSAGRVVSAHTDDGFGFIVNDFPTSRSVDISYFSPTADAARIILEVPAALLAKKMSQSTWQGTDCARIQELADEACDILSVLTTFTSFEGVVKSTIDYLFGDAEGVQLILDVLKTMKNPLSLLCDQVLNCNEIDISVESLFDPPPGDWEAPMLECPPELCPWLLPPVDSDGDGVSDDEDECPNDPEKAEPGDCGCGNPDTPECLPTFCEVEPNDDEASATSFVLLQSGLVLEGDAGDCGDDVFVFSGALGRRLEIEAKPTSGWRGYGIRVLVYDTRSTEHDRYANWYFDSDCYYETCVRDFTAPFTIESDGPVYVEVMTWNCNSGSSNPYTIKITP